MSAASGLDETLLRLLRAEAGRPGLVYAQAPERIVGGHETEVYAVALKGAPEGWDGPLVLRCFGEGEPPGTAALEAAIHEGLHAQGFPVPRIVAARDDEPAFLLMERLPGRALGDGIEVESGFVGRVRALALLARLAVGLPERLARVTRRLLALDAGPVLDALRARGISHDRIRFERHLGELERRIGARSGLAGLRPGFDWLLRERPGEPERLCVCHGDLTPNLVFDGGRLAGVIDWSGAFATVGDPAYELGNSQAMIRVPVPVPRPLWPLVSAVQTGLIRAFAQRVGTAPGVTPERVRYYETWRHFRSLLGAAETWLDCAEGAAFPERPDPWKVPAVALRVCDRVAAHMGAALELPAPPDV